MYTLYGFPKTRSFRVTWALQEIGLPFEYRLINLLKGEHLQPPFSELSPAGKVPLLMTPDGPLAESAAILTYLADKHGQQEFIPKPATYERGCFEQVMYFLMTELEQPLWTRAKHTFILPEKLRQKAMFEVSDWEFGRALKVFAGMLADRPFVCGDRFSMADIVAAHVLGWARSESVAIPHDPLNDYLQRMQARPAYQQARELEANVAARSLQSE